MPKKKPELDRWSDVHETVVAIEDFLQWLGSKGIGLCERDEMADGIWYPTPRNRRELLEEYFEIDARKLEKERRALLDDIRKKNEELKHDKG